VYGRETLIFLSTVIINTVGIYLNGSMIVICDVAVMLSVADMSAVLCACGEEGTKTTTPSQGWLL
jgi:hypothetical protein